MSRYKRKMDGERKAKPAYALAVAELREACGLSQHTLASALGIADNTVARWEMGVREPDKWNYLLLYQLALEKRAGQPAGVFRSHLENGITAAGRVILSTLGITPTSAKEVYTPPKKKGEL